MFNAFAFGVGVDGVVVGGAIAPAEFPIGKLDEVVCDCGDERGGFTTREDDWLLPFRLLELLSHVGAEESAP